MYIGFASGVSVLWRGCRCLWRARVFGPSPLSGVVSVWGVFVVVFVFWRCFVVCFGLVWVLFCCCVATVLLEGGLSGLGVSFYVLVSLLGGFSVCLRLVFLVVLGDFRREFESPPGYHRCPHGQGK